MTSFELVAVFYFVGLGVAAAAADVPWRRRGAVMVLCFTLAAAIAAIGQRGTGTFRQWVPHGYLIAGYWVPALLTRSLTSATRFERWLVRSDQRSRPMFPAIPAPLVHITELAYLFCYPLVPASFMVVWGMGTAGDVGRFWVAVLTAGYACYAMLPWLSSRPPRLVTGAGASHALGAVNAFVLGRVSHQLNTFPSGHVAVSLAAAGAVWPVSPVAGLTIALISAAVAVGAAAGRYHYVVDVVLGVAVAAVAVGVSWIRGA